ncbi:MAG: hypothetical protein IJQ75_01875 [Synergistaceae bacterium]|nr:hypothetical protein [Synergistaceae bacterium]
MIKEVISIEMNPKTPACEVIIEWAEETAKYFDVPFVLDTSFGKLVYEIYRDMYGATVQFGNWKYRLKKFIKKLLFHGKNMSDVFPGLGRLRMKKRQLQRQNRFVNARIPTMKQDFSSALSIYYLNGAAEILACDQKNCIPIVIDAWNDGGVKYLVDSTKNLKLFYVTSRYIYDHIKAENPNSNIRYMPLSVSDKHYSPNFERYRSKTVDVIQFGRKDPILHEYMLRYSAEHQNVDYVYSEEGKRSDYLSTIRGNIGPVSGRYSFMQTLESARVSLVSSPGMDKNQPITYGVSFPTPRFYESAVLGCSLIGRYPNNEEFRELNMSRYCPNITSYEQFVHELERALAMTPEELYAQNHDFIINSLTSKRAEQIRKDLEALTCQNS